MKLCLKSRKKTRRSGKIRIWGLRMGLKSSHRGSKGTLTMILKSMWEYSSKTNKSTCLDSLLLKMLRKLRSAHLEMTNLGDLSNRVKDQNQSLRKRSVIGETIFITIL